MVVSTIEPAPACFIRISQTWLPRRVRSAPSTQNAGGCNRFRSSLCLILLDNLDLIRYTIHPNFVQPAIPLLFQLLNQASSTMTDRPPALSYQHLRMADHYRTTAQQYATMADQQLTMAYQYMALADQHTAAKSAPLICDPATPSGGQQEQPHHGLEKRLDTLDTAIEVIKANVAGKELREKESNVSPLYDLLAKCLMSQDLHVHLKALEDNIEATRKLVTAREKTKEPPEVPRWQILRRLI